MAATLIPHLDDVACAHGANQAMIELATSGAVTCGSVMVPAPWFPEVAAHPGLADLDLGVHLTLTSESPTLRWRPLSTTDPASGLIDARGYLWPTVGELRRHATAAAVEAELRAQIDAALSAGVDVTHLDHHMGAALTPEFVDVTVRIATEYRLPVLFPADLAGYVAQMDETDVDVAPLERARQETASAGLAVADRFVMPLARRDDGDAARVLQDLLTDLPDGVTYLSLHCAAPGDVEAVHPRDAAWRLAEYATFSDPAFRAWLDGQPVALAGMRAFRDEARAR